MTEEQTEELEQIIALLSWHYDEEADEENLSPVDMTAHVNGVCIKKLKALFDTSQPPVVFNKTIKEGKNEMGANR